MTWSQRCYALGVASFTGAGTFLLITGNKVFATVGAVMVVLTVAGAYYVGYADGLRRGIEHND